MKKAIKLLCGIMCLFMVMTVLLTGCDFGNVDVAHGKDQTPVYYGMLLFDSSDVKIPEVNYVDETSNSSDNQYGWYKDNDGLIRSIHDKHEPLYVSQNQDVYAYVGISNPSEFQIVSFVINGQTFTSDMFDARSTNEVKIVKLNVGNARGIVEYTVSDIKYADGKEIKNVYMLGDPVAKASVKAENQITATVNKVELKDSGKEIFFDITITDEYGLIASGKGNVKLLVYRDGKVQKEAELTGGENKITIKTLNKNKEHEYEIVAYYDDFSGQGTSDHTLVSKYPLQKDHSHTFGEWETTKAPTCGKDGEKARICSGCGTGETEKLSATGLHSFDNNCDATCNGCEFTRTVGDHVYDNACDWNCNICGYPRTVGDHVYDDQYDDTCNECGFVRDADCKHVYDNDCDTICNACGEIRTVDPSVHVYDNACDWNCNVCGYPRAVGDHVYDDQYDDTCNECGFVRDADCKHVYDNDCDTICNACGEIRTVDPSVHVYDNDCDWNCNVCGYPRAVGDHVYDDQYDDTCNECGFVRDADCKHVYDNDCDTICNACGEIRTVDPSVHVYDNACDWNCNVCGYPRAVGDHVYDDQYDDTCNECGFVRDAECAHKNVTTLAGKAANCVEIGLTEGKKCTDCGETIVEQTTIPATGVHTFENGICVNCKCEQYSEGLEYTSNGDGTCYVSGIGTCTDTYIIIPSTSPEGESVVELGNQAFMNCTFIEKLFIPKTIRTSYWDTFTGCSIKEVHIEDLSAWCEIYFSMNICCNPMYSGADLYLNNEKVTMVVIPDSMTWIKDNVFDGCTSISSVVIHANITSISYDAFRNCINLNTVYYMGSETDWNNIVIWNDSYSTNDDYLINATRYYYSETQPTTGGNFWHWVDGVPTAWEVEIHTHSYTSTVTPPTATENGVITYTCSCGDSYTEEIVPSAFTVTVDNRAMVGYTGAENENLVIPSVFENNGTWYRVTSIGSGAFGECSNLTSVIIPDSVVAIWSRAFANCSKLTNVMIGNSVTSIEDKAFSWSGLESITIPNSVTTIEMAFYDCANLKSITVDKDNAVYQSIDGNLYSKDGTVLIAYAIGKPDTSFVVPNSVTSIDQYAFYNCPNIESVVLGNSVISIGYQAFRSCYNLKSVTISDSVTTIHDWAFANCSNLVNVSMGNSVTSIGFAAFNCCDSLVNITLPDSLCSIGNSAFYFCTSLTEITIGKSVADIGQVAFSGCDSLTCVYYTGTESEWAKISFGQSNDNLINATRYYYSETQPTTEGNFWHWVDGVPTVWEVEIHTHSYTSTVTPPTATANGVITYTCSCTDSYTEELIPQDFTVTQGNRAMIGYTGAENENLVIPAVFENNGTWYRVNAIGDWIFGDLAFENRSNLISVTIPDSVTTIGYGAFSDCNGISSITIPKSVVSIGRGAFADCDTLTEIVVDGYNTTYQSINGNVYTKDGTVLVAYAVGKSEISFEIPNSVIIIGEGAFSGCYNLTNVTIPNSVTTIGIEAFYRCFGLTSIVIPDSVTDIDTWAFYCSGLQSVTIGAGVKNVGTASFFACSSLKTIVFKDGAAVIGSWMFGDCSSLTDVVIPNSISLIYGDAFDRCSVLKNIYYKGTAEEWNAIVIDNTYPSSNNILDFTIYYYSETQPITEGNFWHYVDGVPTVWQIHTHSYTSAVTTEPTATANGVITYTCSCGDSYIEELVPQDFTITADNRAMVGYTGAAGETLVIPSRIQIDGNWHRVTSIGDYAFSDCSNLVSVIIPNSVTSIGTGAFMLCSNLSNTKIPNSVRSVGSYAFYGCDKLMQKENGIFYVDKWAVDYDWYSGNSLSNYVSLRSDTIGIAISALSYYDALKGIVLPSGLKYIDDCAFTGCSNLTSINIPSSVIRVGGDAFLECDNIVTTQGGVEYVGNWAVWCDSDIREVTLRQGTVGLCDWLFTYCTYLFDITLPNSVKYIGENQFGENRWDGRVYLRFDGTIQEFVSILPTDWNPQGIDYSLEIVCSDAIVTLDFRYTVKTENGNWTWVEGMKINFTGTMEQWEKLFPTNWGLIPEKIICSDGVMKLN